MKCKHYTVEAVIQSPNIDANEPVAVHWYRGTNGIKALAALAQAAAHDEAEDSLPEPMRYRTLSVGMTITDWCTEHDGPWAANQICMECTDINGEPRAVAWSEMDGSV